MVFADVLLSRGQIWAPVISATLVALIAGLFTYLSTRSKADQARVSAGKAGMSAKIAEDYAEALAAKDAVINALQERVSVLEEDKTRIEVRCQNLEDEMDEMREALRNASLLERELRQHLELRHDSQDSC